MRQEHMSLRSEQTLGQGPSGKPPDRNMVGIPGGTFLMGSDDHYPEEGPTHYVSVDGFWMDKYTVTNKQFRHFVGETGYVTVAERQPNAADYPDALPELLVPGSAVFQMPRQPVDMGNSGAWWTYVSGANWRHPQGPGSSLRGLADHPVVHVAYEDVEAYVRWAGKELPTEAQWELAARGGLEGKPFVWGDELTPLGKMMANYWQGQFPWENFNEDGFAGTAPVGYFPPNGYGLFDMAGNVWEWTSDWYQARLADEETKPCCAPVNPKGGRSEESFEANHPGVQMPRKVLKGGSHLCSRNYCYRYRPAARIPETIDTSTCHVGFRCVVNVSPEG